MLLRAAALASLLLIAANPPSFAQTAMAILEKNCLACHGPARMGGLDLRQRDAALKGGGRGPAVVPGKPDESLIYTAVLKKGSLQMPPGKQSLESAEIEVIRHWIESGAAWDAAGSKKSEPAWWAFRSLRRPNVPPVNSVWVKNPIDAFIAQVHQANKLAPAAAAERRALIRRVYFDLHGLPPSPGEVDQFANDPDPQAYEKLVDRLLASPRYGERWGRFWLDVVRYADTGGFETDIYFANAWRYRDYVIKSFNDDKPYNQFVQEQIAGDEIWPDNLDLQGSYIISPAKLKHLEARIGTGLYTLAPVMHESGLDAEYLRSEWRADAVDVTASAFLGLTMGCARCHNHKFDPITQRDFYRMAAVFAASEEKEIPTVHIMSVFDYRQFYPKVIAVEQLKAEHDRLMAGAKSRILERKKAKFSKEQVEAWETPEDKRTPRQKELAIDVEAAARSIGEKETEEELTPAERETRLSLIGKIGRAYLKAPKRYPTATVLGPAEIVQDVHVLERGDHKKMGETVQPGAPAVLTGGDEQAFAGPRRKQLAQWLTSDSNPLAARVMVNRIWQGHFGRGIVGTPNDFGRQGDPPTHPELLDWLAAEFIADGWRVKPLHRLILLSNTYQMASSFNSANAKIDPENRYLWRMNRRRLEAEMIRDAVLSAAGTLNLKQGGPPVMAPLTEEERAGLKDPAQWPVALDPTEHSRRSVYLYVKRSFRMPLFETFDMPDPAASCERRNVTTVAPQALALMNNDFMIEQSAQFAKRLKSELPDGPPSAWIDHGFRTVTGRSPTAEESRDLSALFASGSDAPLTRLCLVLFNLNEFLYVD
jgi:mono/diheme cytochrome c family protein